ncbi:HD domain-containing phosphohydrolase [Conexibacter sp. JD483]|uniref:HD-GYP domain-containing protein n=1 Tax=unclassified Conexibacter TaxID=2627773 RepID=UPI00271D13EB|nr:MULTISPECIES: HD domain-containing phosphohydrolase [unclassified Conexibacter]MDO8184344.1 HD domain-containing phosphohydrolase [Conexibacter sp. CPCC 205706]MDO8197650.1 HD domain-containing phosphohydrolase [Conexibacter sp. CPCC 205762]MDR9368313.1 HD domain-containing phosphohydrolase [Conexibacter sp. JD483]
MDWLFAVLALGAIGANLFDAGTEAQSVSVSGTVLAALIAIALFGPAGAFAVIAIGEIVSWAVERYRATSLFINLVGAGAPMLIAGTVFEAIRPDGDGSVGYYLALALAAVLVLVLNLLIVAALRSPLDGVPFHLIVVDAVRPLLVSLAINVPLALAATGLCLELGVAGSLFAVISLVAFGYMAQLVATARHRSKQYASLSWGVLSGLLRTLDIRDPRAARHAAAVAAFARDIAHASGMSSQECELVHTAGLLHDIGQFALSDRVAERGRVLNDEDWTAIRRHPELGADMLRDLGLYGPVAEIVHAHHERIDGRGYPDRLTADEIPEAAKIIAVAEVYDTLTAHDTYRTPISSFEALNELRRVSGTQLDGRYVEILARLLAGSDITYRHADRADFGRELDLERRINDAAAS